MKLVDPNLELLPWKTPQSGPGIGDAVPTNYGYRKYADKLEFYIGNNTPTKNSPSWLGAISRPLPPAGYSNLALTFSLMLDGASWLFARCLEFDIRVCKDKRGYNCSSQINFAEGGMWQITTVYDTWVDTGIKMPVLEPWVRHDFRIEYHFDFLNKRYSVITITVDQGQRQLVPVALTNVGCTPLAWDDSCNLQVQQDMYGVLGGFSQVMKDINLEWTE